MTSSTTPLRYLTAAYPGEPGLDTAISAVLVQRVSDGQNPETLRLYRPGRVVAFGRRDVSSPGYGEAVAAARAGGCEAVERLAGGRAAAFTPGTIAFSWAIPDPDPRQRTEARFEMVSELIRGALGHLGVDAHVGEVAGEYCPGRFSVNAGRTRKLMGVGQRLKRHAAHLGGVLVVEGSAPLIEILSPVYAALDLEWIPETTGAVADVVPGVTFDAVVAAITERIGDRRPLEPASVPDDLLAAARELAPDLVPGRRF
jgi:lipoate-protein ligase A